MNGAAVRADLTPPTANVPEFARYPLRYGYRNGGIVVFDTPLLTEAHRLARMYRVVHPGLVLTAAHIAPDGRYVVTAPVPGGTLGGDCGSTRWVVDTDAVLQQAETLVAALSGRPARAMQRTSNSLTATTQARWLNGHAGSDDGYDGFRVECAQGRAHDGLPCRFRTWSWDADAGTVL